MGFVSGYNFGKGNSLMNQKKYREAISAYTEALKGDPNHAATYVNLSKCYLALGDWDSAIVYSKQALNLAPRDVAAHNNLGVAYMRKGLLLKDRSYMQDSITELFLATQISPQFNLAAINLKKAQGYLDEMKRVETIHPNQASQPANGVVYKEKEIIREIVKIPCPYCGTLVENTSQNVQVVEPRKNVKIVSANTT